MIALGTDAFAAPPIYGPLQAQNNLDDVDSASTSLANLGGLSSATAAATYAPLASPTFTGIVTIPSGSILNTPASINLSNYLASPPAIGGTTAAAGSFTTITATGNITGGTAGVSGGGENFYMQNLNTATNTTAAIFAQTGTSNAFVSLAQVDGATPEAVLSSASGDTGGLNIEAQAGGIHFLDPSNFTTINASGTITPSTTAGIVGTTAADNAQAGSVGEYMSSSVGQGSVSLSSGSLANITSLSLTAGDWDCRGNIIFQAAGSTTASLYSGWINTTSASLPGSPNGGALTYLSGLNFGAGAINEFPVGEIRENISTTTTVYLSGFSNFATSTMTAGGFLGCRRVR